MGAARSTLSGPTSSTSTSPPSSRRFDLGRPWLRYHGLGACDVAALVEAVATALDGRQLSREELGREVVRLLGEPKYEELLASG